MFYVCSLFAHVIFQSASIRGFSSDLLHLSTNNLLEYVSFTGFRVSQSVSILDDGGIGGTKLSTVDAAACFWEQKLYVMTDLM